MTSSRSADSASLCLTPENLNAPWIHFEAGALAGRFRRDRTSVCPYLYSVKPSDLRGPLSRFQAVLANEEGTRKMFSAMNNALGGDRLEADVLNTVFNRWWPDLDTWLKGVSAAGQQTNAKTPESAEQSESKLTRDVLVPKSVASMAREGNVEQAIHEIQKLLPQGDDSDLDQNQLEEKVVTLLLLSANPPDWDRAAEYVLRLREPKYYLRLAYKFWTVQQLDTAIRWVEDGLPLAVNSKDSELIAKFKNSLAYYYAESGDPKYKDLARNYVAEAVKALPGNVEVLDTFGCVKIAYGENREEVKEGIDLCYKRAQATGDFERFKTWLAKAKD